MNYVFVVLFIVFLVIAVSFIYTTQVSQQTSQTNDIQFDKATMIVIPVTVHI